MRQLDYMGSARASIALLMTMTGASCTEVPGECDSDRATRVVHADGEGEPAFAGQALVVSSCGYGAFCHAETATGMNRFGAPVAFDLDVAPASYDESVGDVERLDRQQRFVAEHRDAIWGAVDSGSMPPGANGRAVLENPIRPRYRAYDEDPAGVPLPALDTAEGREILRNWLACGTPVIERPIERRDAMASIGFVAGATCVETDDCRMTAYARCDTTRGLCTRCVDDADCAHLPERGNCASGRCQPDIEPTWEAIHDTIIARSCAIADCHLDPQPDAETQLDLGGGAEALYARLSTVSTSELCGPLALPLVTPGDPSASLLHVKLLLAPGSEEDAACGTRMPYGSVSGLPSAWIDAIDAWITAGAPGP
ncbi:MAG: hypothetical protein AB7S26_21765 [Sandaracinaceae bacterium]